MNKDRGRTPAYAKQIVLLMALLGLVVAVLALSPGVQAAGESIYVDPSGDNDNPGTLNQPLRTIQAGVDRASAGDTIYVRAGTYVEEVKIASSGTSGSPITVRAYPGESPVIDGRAGVDCLNCGLPDGSTAGTDPVTGRSFNYATLVSIEGDHVVFEGFVVKRSMGRGIRVWRDSRASHVTVRNNEVLDSRNAGILLQITENVLIENNVVWHSGSYAPWVDGRTSSVNWPAGIVQKDSNHVTIRGNTVYENWGEGINNWDTSYATYEDNIVYDNFAVQMYVDYGEYVTIQRNLVYHTNDPEWRRGDNPSPCLVLAEEDGLAILARDVDIVNNVVGGCRQNFAIWGGGGTQSVENLLVAHNTFINAVTNDPSDLAQNVSLQQQSSSNARFENNIIYQANTSAGHDVGYVDSSISYARDLWHPHHPEVGDGSGPGDIVGQDPQFADPRAYELPENWTQAPSRLWFRIEESSPVVDAGEPSEPFLDSTEINLDIFLGYRDVDPDLGVHEHGNFLPAQFLPLIAR